MSFGCSRWELRGERQREREYYMYRGASNFLSETPEIYEIAVQKPQVIPNGPFPAAEPRENWSRRNNPSRATHALTESKCIS